MAYNKDGRSYNMRMTIPVISNESNAFSSLIIKRVEHYFSIEDYQQDISIISHLDVRIVFFIYKKTENTEMIDMVISMCNNLNKKVIFLCSDPLTNDIKTQKCVFSELLLGSNNFSLSLKRLREKTKYIFNSHFDINRKNNQNNANSIQEFKDEVIDYINNNLTSSIKEEDIAERCHCSTTYFSKKFHHLFGVSFRDFLCDQRILLAKRLILENTDVKIAAIAYQCGYHDVSYFSRIFKKRTGVTPATYRRACIENMEVANFTP